MQPFDVVQVEVGEEEEDGPAVLDVAVRLIDAVSGVEKDVAASGVDQGADGVSGGGVIPAVGAEEDDVHVLSLRRGAPFSQLLADLLRQAALYPLEDRKGLLGAFGGFFISP